jgi:serine/threonine-protein kinase
MASNLTTRAAGDGGEAGRGRAAPRIAPGDVIAERYEVEETLGSGGMGVVVAARHRALGQRVAMKFVSASTSADADSFERFSREARIVASLESEHVVRIVDFGMHGATPFMAMELLAGRDLGRELDARGMLPVAEAVGCVIQACDGLQAAHAKGIVHRDVKLANLFLALRADGERVLKVLDFGVSKLHADTGDEVDLTRTSSMIGSPHYMSPEQIRDPRSVDERADIWSLGVVLHKLLTGRAPFVGQTSSALCAAVAADPPVRLRSHAPHLSAELEAVVLRCLEKKPADRYASVAALAGALAPFATEDGRRIALRLLDVTPPERCLEAPRETPRPTSATDGPEQTQTSSVAEPRSRSERRAWIWAAVVVLAGIVAVAAGVSVRRAAGADPHAASATSTAAPGADSASAGQPTIQPTTTPMATGISEVVGSPAAVKRPLQRVAPGRRAPRSAPPPAAGPTPRPVAASTSEFGGTALDDHL